MGSEGSLELVNEVAVVLRRPGEADATFDFPLPPGDLHEPALVPWLTEVRDSLHDRRLVTPSFDDGVAVAEAMDRLRGALVPAGCA